MKPKISASIMCSDMYKLEKNVKILNDNNIEFIHYDLMDAHYAPNLVLTIAFMDEIRQKTDIPLDIHFMHTDSQYMFDLCKQNIRPGDQVAFHLNNCKHPLRLAQQIKDIGAKPGLVLAYETPLCFLDDVIWDFDFVQIMSIPTGIAGAKFIEGTYDKVRRIRKYLDERGLDLPIQIDGSVTLDNVDKVLECGINVLVLGYVGCFNETYGVDRMLKDMRAIMNKY